MHSKHTANNSSSEEEERERERQARGQLFSKGREGLDDDDAPDWSFHLYLVTLR